MTNPCTGNVDDCVNSQTGRICICAVNFKGPDCLVGEYHLNIGVLPNMPSLFTVMIISCLKSGQNQLSLHIFTFSVSPLIKKAPCSLDDFLLFSVSNIFVCVSVLISSFFRYLLADPPVVCTNHNQNVFFDQSAANNGLCLPKTATTSSDICHNPNEGIVYELEEGSSSAFTTNETNNAFCLTFTDSNPTNSSSCVSRLKTFQYHYFASS